MKVVMSLSSLTTLIKARQNNREVIVDAAAWQLVKLHGVLEQSAVTGGRRTKVSADCCLTHTFPVFLHQHLNMRAHKHTVQAYKHAK